jgi:hypothetical protein
VRGNAERDPKIQCCNLRELGSFAWPISCNGCGTDCLKLSEKIYGVSSQKRNPAGFRLWRMDGEKMSSTAFHIVSVVAGLTLLATYYGICWIFPVGGKMKHLAQGLAVTVTLAMSAAFLLASARSFGP